MGNRDSWRAQTKPCMHQDRGERSSYPHKTEPDLPANVRESPPEAEPGAPTAAALAAAGVLA